MEKKIDTFRSYSAYYLREARNIPSGMLNILSVKEALARSIGACLLADTPYAARNIFVRLAVKCYMADVHRKRPGRKAVQKVEPGSSMNVGKNPRTRETQANISMVRMHLTTKEAQVLELLAGNPGRVFSRDSLLKMIWGYADGVISRTVEVHIQRLRKKLKGNLGMEIRTILGRGYVLEHPGQPVVTIASLGYQ
jgi:DNA-binding response OmpR family regulator